MSALTQQEREQRRLGLGGSDMAAVLGVSKWKTAAELYREKTDPAYDSLLAEDETRFQEWGRRLEPVIAQAYSERTGRVVMRPTQTLEMPDLKFLRANIDGFSADREQPLGTVRGFEAKTAGFALGWGAEGTDEIPTEYIVQCQHYLLVSRALEWDVAVLIGGSDFRIYTVIADVELHMQMIEIASAFWSGVQSGVAPPLDTSHPTAMEFVKRLYPGTNGQTMTADENLERWYGTWQESAALASRYEALAVGAKAHLLSTMGEHAALRFKDGKQLRRQLTKRKAYSVEPTEYVDARLVNAKED